MNASHPSGEIAFRYSFLFFIFLYIYFYLFLFFICFLLFISTFFLNRELSEPIARAKKPLEERFHLLDPKLPVSFLVGDRTWMSKESAKQVFAEQVQIRIKNLDLDVNESDDFHELQLKTMTFFHEIKNSSHHIYIDNVNEFNNFLNSRINYTK